MTNFSNYIQNKNKKDQLLSDLDNVSSTKSTPSNSRINLKENDFIQSINQIVNSNSNTKYSHNSSMNGTKPHPRIGSLTTLNTNTSSNYSITHDEYDDEYAHGSGSGAVLGVDAVANRSDSSLNLNVNSNSASSTASNSRLADLTELDNLLDDLYQAKQKLAKFLFLKQK